MLYLIYVLAIILINIHLLNMLIAIMGDTYTKRNNCWEQIIYKDHLQFVIDNFFVLKYSFKDI